MPEKVNGEDVVVHAGDHVVTLEERLAAMQRSIRILNLLMGGLLAILFIHAILSPEAFDQLVRGVLEILQR